MNVSVIGVGMSRFTRMTERRSQDVGAEAVMAALRDAGITGADVEAAFCGSVQESAGIGQAVLKEVGITGIPIANVENACASGGTAFREAIAWIESGAAEVVLAFGVEMLTRSVSGLIATDDESTATLVGLPLPGLYALKAQHYLATYDATPAELASVVVKSRRNAVANEYAHFRKPTTVEEVLASAMIAEPLTLFQCCPNVDGAAAAVLCTERAARRFGARTAVRVAGAAVVSGNPVDRVGSIPDATERAATLAYHQAGLGPEDVDVCEVHEPFSIAEVLHVESLGFCREGEGSRYIASGRADIGGDGVAVNPSGGLLSRGHPLGATGIAQIAELTWQLRGAAGDRQREGARVGLAHIMGGTIPELDSNACLIHILTS